LGVGLFSSVTSNRARGNGPKLHQWRLNIRKGFFLQKSGQALEWAPPGGGEAIIPRDVQETYRCGKEGQGLAGKYWW